jgi:two-component system, cell cycle sensor histidine kinase and response regulator CckA
MSFSFLWTQVCTKRENLKSFHCADVSKCMSEVSSQPTILLVEDDDQIRTFVRTLLHNENYRVVDARTGTEGLRKGLEAAGGIDLLLSDMLLPGLSGYDLAVRLREVYPSIRIVLMTGYVEGEIVQRCLEELNARFLDKPFQPSQLRQLVRDELNARSVTSVAGI